MKVRGPNDLPSASLDFNQSLDAAIEWIPDCDVANCSSCKVAFSLKIRKHHCRKCGLIFCNECSTKRVPFVSLTQHEEDNMHLKPERVCGTCYNLHCDELIQQRYQECISASSPNQHMRESQSIEFAFESLEEGTELWCVCIDSRINGSNPLYIHSPNFEAMLSINCCRITTPREVAPFPKFSLQGTDMPTKDLQSLFQQQIKRARSPSTPADSQRSPSKRKLTPIMLEKWSEIKRNFSNEDDKRDNENFSQQNEEDVAGISGKIQKDDGNSTEKEWKLYVERLLRHGRGIVIDAPNAEYIEINQCIIEGRVAVTILDKSGGKNIIFRGCLLRGECAAEIRSHSGPVSVTFVNCVFISSSAKVYLPEDLVTTPMGMSGLEDKDPLYLSLQNIYGPCIVPGTAIFVADAKVEIKDSIIMGNEGIYATKGANIQLFSSFIRSFLAAISAWDHSTVLLNNCVHIGKIDTNNNKGTIKAITTVNEVYDITDPLWVSDSEVWNCRHCNSLFTLTNRKHHCRMCGDVLCDECSAERGYLPQTHGKSELVRLCLYCVVLLMNMIPLKEPKLPEKKKEQQHPLNIPEGISVSENSQKFAGISGQMKTYEESVEDKIAYRISVPIEFNKVAAESGRSTRWMYTDQDQAHSYYVIITVSDEEFVNPRKVLRAYQQDPYLLSPDIVKVRFHDTINFALAILTKQSMNSEKAADDSHSWTFEVFHNLRVFRLVLKSDYSAFKSCSCQRIFSEIINSFQLVSSGHTRQAQPPPFSMQFQEHVDISSRYKVKVPLEAMVLERGLLTVWRAAEAELTISVNVTELDFAADLSAMCTTFSLPHRNNRTVEFQTISGENSMGFVVKDLVSKGKGNLVEDDVVWKF